MATAGRKNSILTEVTFGRTRLREEQPSDWGVDGKEKKVKKKKKKSVQRRNTSGLKRWD